MLMSRTLGFAKHVSPRPCQVTLACCLDWTRKKQYLWRYGLGIFPAWSLGLCEEQQHLHLQRKVQVTPYYTGHDKQEAGLWCLLSDPLCETSGRQL